MKKSTEGFAIKSEIAKSPKAKINSKGSPVLIFPPKRVNLFLSKGVKRTKKIKFAPLYFNFKVMLKSVLEKKISQKRAPCCYNYF